jgi:N6-L-threonylcarbamoyladenine synthase
LYCDEVATLALFLALETSCDETSAAVFTDDLKVLSNAVVGQNALHEVFGGVVPEIAAREHLRKIVPTIELALTDAKMSLQEIDAIAVHYTPGLAGALLIGVTAGKALAFALGKPLIAVNHVYSHVYACRVAAGKDIFPCVGFVISGGHTVLFDCRSPLDFSVLGTTRDDAAGEAFDKVSAVLGLGFPGGPAVEREATAGDTQAYAFPRSMLHDGGLDMSFSGLKTAVTYALHGNGVARGAFPGPGERRANLAASFQAAVVDVLVGKARKALEKTGYTRLAVGGGVIANRAIRNALTAMITQRGYELFIPPMEMCTDNAAMAALAVEKWKWNDFAPWDLDVQPNAFAGQA